MPSDQMMLQVFFMGMILGGVVGFVAGSSRKSNDAKAVERVERAEEDDDPADWWKRT